MASGTINLDVLPEYSSNSSCAKLTNGVQICWGQQVITTTSSDWADWAGGKRATKSVNIPFAESFMTSTSPTVIAQVRNGGDGSATIVRVTTNTGGITSLYLWGNGYVGTYDVSYIAIGRWA